MRKLLPCIVMLVFTNITIVALSQVVISGKVLDSAGRQPLGGVLLLAADGRALTVSANDGYFSFTSREFNAIARFVLTGYRSVATYLQGNGNTVWLNATIVNLQDVTISSVTGKQRFSSLAKIDLDLQPVKNTQELMRLVPGLFVAQHAGGGKAEQIFLRGFDCDHGTDIQVSVDGMPVNMVSHAHGQGYADTHFIIPETVNNTDYGTGPYYTQHGNLNTAGYVSFSTFDNISRSRVQVEAGRYDTYRALAMIDLLKRNKEKQSAYIAGEANYTNGPTLNNQHFNRFNVFGKYNLAISYRTRLTASLSAFNSKWDASGQVPERAVEDGSIDRFGSVDPSEGGNTSRYNANVVLTHRLSSHLLWENQAYYSRYAFNLYSNFTFYLNNPVNGDEINQREHRNLYGFTSRLTNNKIYGNYTINTVYGVGLRYDDVNNSFLANVEKRVFVSYVTRGNVNEANGFGYVQKQLVVGKWFIEAGTRLDYLHFNYQDKLGGSQLPARGKAIVSPKLNIQYTINPAVQVYVKAGKGFHSNDSRVVVANEGKEILPAAYGADAGIVWKPTRDLYINVASWYLYLQQEFVYVGDEGIVEPSGKTRRQGIDVIARYQLSRSVFANVNVNLTRARAIGEEKGADYIPLAPSFTSTGGLFYKKATGFNGGIHYRYIKNRPANENNTIMAKGYCVVDLSLNYTQRNYEIGLAVENVLNTTWNEAQFATESILKNEATAVDELHFTPGTLFFPRLKLAVFF